MRHPFAFGLVLGGLVSGGAFAPPALAAPGSHTVAASLRAEAGGKYEDFYEARGYRPIWFANGKAGPAAWRLLSHIEGARADGLDPADYEREALRGWIAAAGGGDAEAIARAELAFSRAFVNFVTDMREPERVGMKFLDKTVRPRKRDTATVLRAATVAPSFGDYVASMGWMSPHYVRQRKLVVRALAGRSSATTIERLRLNLERARILPSAWTHHIVVDSASGRLWYYQAGAQKGTMKVVVGAPASPTPMYAGVVQYAVLQPYWNVPVDLVRTLIAPKVLAGQSLPSLGYEALSGWGRNARPLDPGEIDWRAVAEGRQDLRVRQLPGPRNAMGRVKFMFPNETGIFLHDTPDRKLFARSARHFSNGCVRLEDAAALGKWLMGRPLPAKTAQPEQVAMLSAPVPIYMTYFTAVETKKGVAFLADVYGRDGGGARIAAN